MRGESTWSYFYLNYKFPRAGNTPLRGVMPPPGSYIINYISIMLVSRLELLLPRLQIECFTIKLNQLIKLISYF